MFINSYFRQLANSTGGRFHWFRETGIIDSDDVRLLQEEIDTAVEYMKQAEHLVNCSKQKRDVKDAEKESRVALASGGRERALSCGKSKICR
ncbi:unnamed protein product [Protopolystoma xenopodis]|uniref:Uncharacterized protein n=1 Tax=Protopolystoma xenopodis TaxID=117903 RepID=A0A448XRV3_9PLAT|nr:unnamed protein product [Protopolystoma xenopodis]